MLISALKWPELQMMAPSFIAANESASMTLRSPVTVIQMSQNAAASTAGITR